MADVRSKISTVWAHFLAHMKGLEGTTGTGSTILIRKVAEGEVVPGAHPVANVLLALTGCKNVGRVDRDKQWAQGLRIRIETTVSSAEGAVTEILSKIAQVEDRIDGYTRPDGSAGFEDADWGISYATDPQRGGTVMAESKRTFTVTVTRGAN